MINTRFFCLPSRFLYLRPSMMAHRIIAKVRSETNVRCCQDIYPSAGREYPPKPKNSLILISHAWILHLYSSSHLLSLYYITPQYVPQYAIIDLSIYLKSFCHLIIRCTITSIAKGISAPPSNCLGVCLFVLMLEIYTGIANSAQIAAGT